MTAKSPLDRLRSQKKPFTQKISICLDAEVADEYDAAKAAVDEIEGERQRVVEFLNREMDDDLRRRVDDSRARLDAAEEALEARTEEFVFRGIGRVPLDELVDKNPPTKTQISDAQKKGAGTPDFNPDTFPIALCASACESHDMSYDEWKILWADEKWSGAETDALFQTAYAANTRVRVVDLGKGSAAKRS